RLVTASGGTISVTDADARDTVTDSGPAEVLGSCHLDIHAASLLLVGGRTLADARRLGLRADADPSAEAFLDALLAGPRPSVLDAFCALPLPLAPDPPSSGLPNRHLQSRAMNRR